MRTDLCGITLEHPILNGSGTFDLIAARRAFGNAVDQAFPFAAFVTKTITVEPRVGNPTPRLWELPAGMINSIGLPNKGLDGFLADDLPQIATLPVPLVVSVMGTSVDELTMLVDRVAACDEVSALELNFSCPNVKSGTVIGADPTECGAMIAALRPLTSKPMIVKLTPNATDVGAVALAAQAAGADAVSLINTLRGMALTPGSNEPWLGGGTGGVSGPAVRAVALAQTAEVTSRIQVPVVAMGGVATAKHAQDLLNVGARCVAVGTENFRNPAAAAAIVAGLTRSNGVN